MGYYIAFLGCLTTLWRQTFDMSFMLEIAFNKIWIILSLYIQAILYSEFLEGHHSFWCFRISIISPIHAKTRNKYAAEKIRFERTIPIYHYKYISCAYIYSCIVLCICVCSNAGQNVSHVWLGQAEFYVWKLDKHKDSLLASHLRKL